MRRLLGIPVLPALLLAACGDTGDSAESTERAGPPEPLVIEIEQSRFGDDVTVRAGTTVTFVNLDPFAHTVTERDGAFDSGDFGQDESYSFEASEPGSIDLYCVIHPTMRITVNVEG